METREIRTLDELQTIANILLDRFVPATRAHTVALSGDLGAGKTAFVKLLGKELGIAEEITSPTFVVMKSYHIPNHPHLQTLTHIDAYRIESLDEMRVLGFTELLSDPTRLIAVEWPERISDSMPKDAQTVSLTLKGDVRTVTF
jgi:tRNA threonylcarbamoyladenosine biosynthesis protein TsaE